MTWRPQRTDWNAGTTPKEETTERQARAVGVLRISLTGPFVRSARNPREGGWTVAGRVGEVFCVTARSGAIDNCIQLRMRAAPIARDWLGWNAPCNGQHFTVNSLLNERLLFRHPRCCFSRLFLQI